MNCLLEVGPETQIAELTEPDEIEELTQVLEDVARQLGWHPGGQLRVCQPVTRHLAVLVRGEVVGGLQLVTTPDAGQLAFRSVWPEAMISDTQAAHIPVLALREEYRGRFGLFWPLCVELWRCCCAQGVQAIIVEATAATLRLYQRLGWPLEIIGDLRPHWGEDCYLCRMDVQDVAAALALKAQKSKTYRLLVEQAYRSEVADCRLGMTGGGTSAEPDILLPANVLLPAEKSVEGETELTGSTFP